MIQLNPLQNYIDGGPRAAITSPPSASLVFDLPGRAIWVKGVKLIGTDHTYTFSHDNYINLTNTPDPNNNLVEDIKIGININTLKAAIDTTYTTGSLSELQTGTSTSAQVWAAKTIAQYVTGLIPSTKNITINGLTYAIFTTETSLPTFLAPTSLGNAGLVLACTANGFTWVNQTSNTDYQVTQSKVTASNDYRILLKKSVNDNNETTYVNFATTLTYNPSTKILKVDGNKVITAADVFTGATSSTDGTVGIVKKPVAGDQNKFLKGDGTWSSISFNDTWRNVRINAETTDKLGTGIDSGPLIIKNGTGITVSWDSTAKAIVITNAAPDAGLVTKNMMINGVNYAFYTSESSLPTIVVPTSLGSANLILATNASGNGLTWVNKPTSNVTTSAVVGNANNSTSQITTNLSNPFYNLIEGNAVTRSILFKAGTGITITSDKNGVITFVNSSPTSDLSTLNLTVNGATYAIYTSASSLPVIIAPTALGSANQILATNSSGNGLVWVNKPVSNVTTTAVIASAANGTTQITAAQANPYYNLLEGGTVTRSIRFVAGDGITISAATDGLITITNSKPHVADDTNTWRPIYLGGTAKQNSTIGSAGMNLKAGSGITVTYLAPGTTGGTTDSGSNDYGTYTINASNQIPADNITGSGTNGWITKWTGEHTIGKLVALSNTVSSQTQSTKFLREDGTWAAPSYTTNSNTWRPVKVEGTEKLGSGINTDALDFAAGNGIEVTYNTTTKKVVIKNTKPDVNHNTDRTGIIKSTVSGTKKTDTTLIVANTSSGLIFEGGTNLFKIGDGTNYVEIPVTPSFTVTDKSAIIGTSLTTIATIAGTDIKAKILPYVRYYNNHDNNIDTLNSEPYIQTAAYAGGAWTGTKPSNSHNGVALFNFQTHSGNYYTQLALDTNLNRLWIRSANNATSFGAWSMIADAGNISNKDATLTTSLTTIATIAGVDIKAKITNYNTDENVKQVDNNNSEWRPILTKNGTGTGTITSTATFADNVAVYMNGNYLRANYFYTESGDMTTTAITRVYCSNDGYIRYKTLAQFTSDIITQAGLTTVAITKTLTPTTSWGATGIGTTDLTTGTYAVQVVQGTHYYSGVLSWYAAAGGMAEEINLHYAGSGTPTRIYLLTSNGQLLIASDTAYSAATSFTFNFRKLL